MYALVLNESRILKWEGRKKEEQRARKKRREKDEFNEEEKSKKQKQRWTHREANKTKTSEVKNKQQSPAHSLSVSPDTSLSDIQVYTPRTTSHTVCATTHRKPQYLPLTSLSQRQKHPSMHPSMQQSVEKRKCESEYKTHKHAMKRTSLVTFKEREQNPRVKFPDCCPLVITVKQ